MKPLCKLTFPTDTITFTTTTTNISMSMTIITMVDASSHRDDHCHHHRRCQVHFPHQRVPTADDRIWKEKLLQLMMMIIMIVIMVIMMMLMMMMVTIMVVIMLMITLRYDAPVNE